MSIRNFLLVIAIVVAGAWIGSACFVDRKSDSLACSVPTDCTAPRTCIAGYCVVPGAGDCPSQCETCDTSVTPHVCTLSTTGGSSFTCPAGVKCIFTCAQGAACKDITCASGAECQITCSADAACDDITCNGRSCTIACTATNACHNINCGGGDNGSCDIQCTASGACNQTTCANACSCSVQCGTATPTDACGPMTCPRGMGNNYCTTTTSQGDPCVTTGNSCNKC